jgi:hypothetical protein
MKPFIQFGGFVNYAIANEFKQNLDIILQSGNTTQSVETSENPFGKSDYGLLVGLGAKKNIFKSSSIIINFKFQRGFGYTTDLKSNNYILRLGLEI